MKTSDLVKHFGSVPKAAKALGYTTASLYQWAKTGIPLRTQAWIQFETGGKLKAGKK
tara:strand:- start:301 stop:471 length:171 start_codon:yes stop_codon:yes gene_type:complete